MTSPHAYFALSFVYSVLFFSQPNVGSRVAQLRCFAEGVASVWFNCDWFYVCDQNGMPPQFVVCPPMHTFDLGSMRCQSVKNVQELTLGDGEHPSIGSAGQRRFPCKPFDGTDEKYWFQILKFESHTAQGAGNSEIAVPPEYLRPPHDWGSGPSVPAEGLRPPPDTNRGGTVPPGWKGRTTDYGSWHWGTTDYEWPKQDYTSWHWGTTDYEWPKQDHTSWHWGTSDYEWPKQDYTSGHWWSTGWWWPKDDYTRETTEWEWPKQDYTSGHWGTTQYEFSKDDYTSGHWGTTEWEWPKQDYTSGHWGTTEWEWPKEDYTRLPGVPAPSVVDYTSAHHVWG